MKKIIVGAIHLPPLPDHVEYPGFNIALKNALADLKAFEYGGVDAVILENNYDNPHKEFVDQVTEEEMVRLAKELKKQTQLPIGISVLWNDYKAAIRISKVIGAAFIRVPVFIDKVKTNYGIIEGKPKEVMSYRNKIGANSVKIYTDIHVKHSKILSPYSIIESADLALKNGSDALIITGRWTAEAPNILELKELKRQFPKTTIYCGSGVNEQNVHDLLKYADGAIVSTSLKEGDIEAGETNMKPYSSRIDEAQVRKLIDLARGI